MSAAPSAVGPHRSKPLSFLVSLAHRSDLTPGLVRTFESLVTASKQGPDMWASVPHVAIVAGFCEKTIRRHLKKFVDRRILYKKYQANVRVQGGTFRHPATYTAHPRAGEILAPRQTWWEHKRHRDQRHASKAAPAAVPPELEPGPVKPTLPARQQKMRQLSRSEEQTLVAKALQLERGHTHDGDRILARDDRDYRAPMSRENAVTSACLLLQIDCEAGKACLRRHGWTFPDDEKPQGP